MIAPTYRSRDDDVQSPVSLQDSLATPEHVRKLPFVDSASIVVGGCSGGGDLALQVASQTNVAAVVAEEPAGVVMAGMFNNSVPRKGARYTPEDSFFLLEDPRRYCTSAYQKTFRARIATINSPIMIIQGSVERQDVPINKFNAEVLIPELRHAGKDVRVRGYPGQDHCFCASSGVPRTSGRPTQ